MVLPPRTLQLPNSLGDQIGPYNWNQRTQSHMLPCLTGIYVTFWNSRMTHRRRLIMIHWPACFAADKNLISYLTILVKTYDVWSKMWEMVCAGLWTLKRWQRSRRSGRSGRWCEGASTTASKVFLRETSPQADLISMILNCRIEGRRDSQAEVPQRGMQGTEEEDKALRRF